jgi:Ca-activated chloride channel homolog
MSARPRFTCPLALVATLALLAAPSAERQQAPAAPQQPPLPSFRAGVDIVSLTVTVTNGDGRYVTGLDAGDFEVFEDGTKQDVQFFNRSNLPIALSLLLDTSASMEDKMRTAQEAAVGFARRLRPEDLGELIDFDSRVDVLQPFTNDTAQLEAAIRKTSAGGSTALYNSIYIALKELKKVRAHTEADVRRQAIVVLSDGEDTSSLVPYDQVLDQAKRSETAIYTIGLRSGDDVQTKGFKEAEFVLRDLAQQTGGRVFFPSKVEDLAGVYSQISEELSSQYMVGYISKNTKRDGAWRRVVVRVDRPGVAARTKLGYFGPMR